MQTNFSNKNIQLATIKDSEAIVALLNSAYRGEESKKGWTSEANLISGETRTNLATVELLIKEEKSVFLKYTNANFELCGCVNLQIKTNRIYLGMFSVNPNLQGFGIGRAILGAAEEYAFSMNINTIFMSVISVRTELINWYERNGYKKTGEIIPFEEDAVSGKHLQKLEFIILEKNL
jgi:ribosomal protein S18 acetylase RimI-like enzyme